MNPRLDIKSATDRWPLVIIYTLMELLFGPTWASSIVNGTLGLNSFWAMVRRPSLVSFVAGQPLGYYGSWALFSLSHHYLVWLAIELTLPQNRPFTRYAVLGDDIVIVHPKVAGYRVRSRLYSSRRSPRWERLWIAATKPPVSATD
ncbi:putative mitochondrial protein AtMg01110 [Primulina tabacum]|uniref:putative mitochondrial protein AtMg01110 n=1 Tax=Primulina tabacum TaxID=48773 RepID=UPI003F5A78EE